jgi:hypothetical protein
VPPEPDRPEFAKENSSKRALFPFLLVLLLPGCGSPPQVSAEHRELVLGLATATSSQDPKGLDVIEESVNAERSAGRMPEPVASEFSRIIALARSGDWPSAQSASYSFRDAQKPTDEDLARVERREMPTAKKLSGSR